MFCLHVYVCMQYMCLVCPEVRRGHWNPPGLGMVVSYHVNLGS